MGISVKLSSIIFTIMLVLPSNFYIQEGSFTIGVENNEEFIWKCNVCNKQEMDEIFGNTWNYDGFFENLTLNRKMKWRVNLVESNLSSLKINVSIWEWTESENWGLEDKKAIIFHYINPSDYGNNLNFTNALPFIPIWFPIPVGDYIGELSFLEIYDVDNRVLATININIRKSEINLNYPSKSISIIVIYNSRGILNSYKLYIEGNVVIVDIALVDIPFYAIPSTICLISTLLVGIVVYIYIKHKKRLMV